MSNGMYLYFIMCLGKKRRLANRSRTYYRNEETDCIGGDSDENQHLNSLDLSAHRQSEQDEEAWQSYWYVILLYCLFVTMAMTVPRISWWWADVKTTYKKPLPTPGVILCTAKIERVGEGDRKTFVRATLEDGNGVVCSIGEVLFIKAVVKLWILRRNVRAIQGQIMPL